jgi:hypothetical protein
MRTGLIQLWCLVLGVLWLVGSPNTADASVWLAASLVISALKDRKA